MLVFRLGDESAPIKLNDILRKSHEEQQKINKEVIAKRKAANIPLEEGESELFELPDYVENEELSDIEVVFKAVSQLELIGVESAMDRVIKSGKDDVKIESDANDIIVEFLKKSMVKIRGLKEKIKGVESSLGDLSVEDKETQSLLTENKILLPVYRACRIWQSLSATEKKTLE